MPIRQECVYMLLAPVSCWGMMPIMGLCRLSTQTADCCNIVVLL